jgi:hypothetical protein
MTTAIDMENLDKFAELVKVAKEQGCYDLVSAAFKSGVKLGSDTENEACAVTADEHMQECEGKSFGVGKAIRARGQA